MHPIALLSAEDLKAYTKYAQLYSIIYNDATTQFTILRAKRVIKKEGEINYQIPSNNLMTWNESASTLLHLAWNRHSSEITEDLLNLGADFTIKNEDGVTALHKVFNYCSALSREFSKYQHDAHINSILSAHVKFANPSNPCDNNGFSHFHIACIANNTKAVQFFLDNGVDVNQVAGKRARYSGFSPLHFAVSRCSIETVELLLRYDVNRCIKDDYGMTPHHQLLNQRIELLGSKIRLASSENERKTLEDRVQKIDKIVFLLLGTNILDKLQIVDDAGLSSFHIACMMQDLSKVESLLDQVKDIDHCVKIDSPVWPGYTALHFAALCNNMNILKLLVNKRGAKIDEKNAEGITPFDVCVKMGCVEDVYSAILLKPNWANILFSDNKIKLGSFLSALQDATQLREFLQNSVDDINVTLPNNSPLWPGCTFLHLAVIMSNKHKDSSRLRCLYDDESTLEQIEELLNHGADVTLINASGMTPLLYAFRQNKRKVCELLRKRHHSTANPMDKDNLSHLHIACAEYDDDLVEKILSSNNVDVNISYQGKDELHYKVKHGCTPYTCAGGRAREMLLQHGASDFSKQRYGTNTLHSACDEGNKEAVIRLVELGADVGAVLDDGRTPLHLAVYENSLKVVEILLQRGADLIIKDKKGNTPLSNAFSICCFSHVKNVDIYRRLMFSMLKERVELQRRLEKETGITMLHIACYIFNVEEVRRQLARGVDVDARVHEDSVLWQGSTALHVLMIKVKFELSKGEIPHEVDIILELLLMNGTDVKVANVDEDTPVHISFDKTKKHLNQRTILLLKHHRDFRVNPIDSEGISHFHLAVMTNNIEVVEKFLEHDANVNQRPDFFAEFYDGCTPLHMAIDYVKRQKTVFETRVVDLLLSHGADVNLEDARGRSALHEAFGAGLLRLHLMKKLLSYGADIGRENIYGRAPFEKLLRSESATVKDIQFFLQSGCRVNTYNSVNDEGYLGIILSKENNVYRELLLEEMIKASDVTSVNEMGRTVIHNAVAAVEPTISTEEYVRLFSRFKGLGCDFDHQDHEGQTALHLAAIFGNDKAISALLNAGADLNIVDWKGKSALSYAVEFCVKCDYDYHIEHHHNDAIEALVKQIRKLNFLRLHVSRLNSNLIGKSVEILEHTDIDPGMTFQSDCNRVKNFTIKTISLPLNQFLSETKAVINYSHMSELKRDVIDSAFETLDSDFDELLPILKLQYRKAVTRFELLESAITSLKLVVGFSLPDLCADIILRFLSVLDLKSLVAAAKVQI